VLTRIRESFAEYVSRPPFAEVCRPFLWHAYRNGRLPDELQFDEVGMWWDGSHDFDVVAREQGLTTLAGSCKWTLSPVGLAELAALQDTLASAASHLPPAPTCFSALFSRSGFTAELQSLAQQPERRVLLLTPEDLVL
jgi:hypothetical protein